MSVLEWIAIIHILISIFSILVIRRQLIMHYCYGNEKNYTEEIGKAVNRHLRYMFIAIVFFPLAALIFSQLLRISVYKNRDV